MRTLLVVLALGLASSVHAGGPRCPFNAGDTPVAAHPHRIHGSEIPIDTIVVLMQENRSFDHYFGRLHLQGQPAARGPRPNASNPDPLNPTGPPLQPAPQTLLCETADLDHSWNGTHREWNNGKMDGFTAENVDPTDPNGHRTLGYYDQATLPFYYALYSTFAMADHYFSSVLTQTFPNRLYLLAGTSFGHIRNDFPAGPTEFAQRSVFNLLDEAVPPVTWKIYNAQLPYGDLFAYVRANGQANIVPMGNFFTDAQNGTLPQVAFLDGIQIATKNVENDEHPSANVQVGQKFAADVINAFIASPQWASGALFLTYDEHGGFYDHLRPRKACVPDGVAPMFEPGDEPGAFDTYGVRVPTVVVSPYAKRHYVSHKVYDHTSILRFIETRFDLPALTKRDANADAMLRLFDFHFPALAIPPALPAATVDLTRPECSASGAFLDSTGAAL